jgi:hypothetical protein
MRPRGRLCRGHQQSQGWQYKKQAANHQSVLQSLSQPLIKRKKARIEAGQENASSVQAVLATSPSKRTVYRT